MPATGISKDRKHAIQPLPQLRVLAQRTLRAVQHRRKQIKSHRYPIVFRAHWIAPLTGRLFCGNWSGLMGFCYDLGCVVKEATKQLHDECLGHSLKSLAFPKPHFQ